MNKWRIILFIITSLLFIYCSENAPTNNDVPIDDDSTRVLTFRDKLFNLPDVEEVIEISNPYSDNNEYSKHYRLKIRQPLDHNNPTGDSFLQCVYLSHNDTTLPVIFMPLGYSGYGPISDELSFLIDANKIVVPHRFYGGALPNTMDWQYLNVRQAAADHHHIVEIFKNLYPGKWISTGKSKGGETCLLHKRFYPEDVDATLARVAPIVFGNGDPRIRDFLLNQVGTATDRNKILEFQRYALVHRDSCISILQNLAPVRNWTFNRIGLDKAFECSVLEFKVYFWQYTAGNANDIPDTNNTTFSSVVYYLDQVTSFYSYSDSGIEQWESYYYQAATELGNYELIYDGLEDLIIALENPSMNLLAPTNVALVFNPNVMIDVDNWLSTEGNNIIYLYGSQDPWTAAAIGNISATNSLKIIEPGFNHGFRLTNMSQSLTVFNTLEQWLGIRIHIIDSN